LPTPKASDGTKGSRTPEGALREWNRGKNKDLGMVVALWPTLAPQDWKSSKSPPLPHVIGGRLNPAWVEWLMGFPKEWTALNDLGMQWFLSKPKKPLKS
jgi:hypothetical protein